MTNVIDELMDTHSNVFWESMLSRIIILNSENECLCIGDKQSKAEQSEEK